MKTVQICRDGLERLVTNVCRDITLSGFKPDYVVGITRGGLIPATLISHYLDVPLHALHISFRDGVSDSETNCWMSEDAFNGKNILVVDDINDTGRTFNWLKEDWQASCFPGKQEEWDDIWHKTVKFATVINNDFSEFKFVDYTGRVINKLEDPQWIEFPWENWWSK